ncbi:hypothetical protein [Dactylosporangium salmoneum]|uniref:Uncharacterized protein n=1 Tax=Dactylosporangium salmoneum TaxID=53361 RepID=A0ABP5UEH0_9ACTN
MIVDERLLATGSISGHLLNADGTPAQAYAGLYTVEGQNYVDSRGINPYDGSFQFDADARPFRRTENVRLRPARD